MQNPKYRDYTRDTTEVLKRLAHGPRLSEAARMVPITGATKVLDYGCGDGGLFENLLGRTDEGNLYGFDPNLLHEMDEDTRRRVTTFSDANQLVAQHVGYFDVVFCLEVCEHLSPAENQRLLENIKTLLKPGGHAVIGVPLESGLSGFLKNIYRSAKGGRQGASVGIACRTLLGQSIAREFDEHGWNGSHIGFEHREFKNTLESHGLSVLASRCLPWKYLGTVLNNEIYFICSKT